MQSYILSLDDRVNAGEIRGAQFSPYAHTHEAIAKVFLEKPVPLKE